MASDDDIFNNLLSPLSLGPFTLSHRVVLAPLTRCRAIDYVPRQAHVEYYAQRASPGGLLITEAVAVSQEGIGFPHSPGIWTDEQVKAWAKVVDAVHEKGAIIFCQIWHVGRASHACYQPGGKQPVSCTDKAIGKGWKIVLADGGGEDWYPDPRQLEGEAEIESIVAEFRSAALKAREAGFDGVEIHAAHGYLLDQFLKDGVNKRSDKYGGSSLVNRFRFPLAVVEAVASAIGQERTAVRISPASDHLDAVDSRPSLLAFHLTSQIRRLFPRLAYLHVTEPRFTRHGLRPSADPAAAATFLSLIRSSFSGGLLMVSGGYTRHSGMAAVRSGAADLVSYGRLFISNPDLPLRFAIDAPLNEYDRSTFYTHDPVRGYVDYPALNLQCPLFSAASTAASSATAAAVPPPLAAAAASSSSSSIGAD